MDNTTEQVMNREPSGESALDAAAKRLERALSDLEQRLARRLAGGSGGDAAFEEDRAKLAAELDDARARERRLEEAGAEASAALGRAITEIRQVLNGAESEVREG